MVMCEAVFTEEPLWGCRLREGQFWGNWVSMFGFTLYRTASMWYIFCGVRAWLSLVKFGLAGRNCNPNP